MKKYLPHFLISLALLLSIGSFGVSVADGMKQNLGAGVSNPNFWKLVSSTLYPINSSWGLNVGTITGSVLSITGTALETFKVSNATYTATTSVDSSSINFSDPNLGSSISNSGTGAMLFYTSSGASLVERMRLNRGNLGIGTTTPSATFSIKGTATFPMLTITSSTGASVLHIGQNGNIGVGTNVPIYPVDVNGSINVSNGSSMSFGSGNASILNSTYDLLFKTWTGTASTEKMRVTSLGSVGIGTSTPDAALNVYSRVGVDYFAIASSSGQKLIRVQTDDIYGMTTTTVATDMTVLQNTDMGASEFTLNGGLMNPWNFSVDNTSAANTWHGIFASANYQPIFGAMAQSVGDGTINTTTMGVSINTTTQWGQFQVTNGAWQTSATATAWIGVLGKQPGVVCVVSDNLVSSTCFTADNIGGFKNFGRTSY